MSRQTRISRDALYPLGFQCGRRCWQQLELTDALQGFDGERLFRVRQRVAARLQQQTDKPLSAAELQLWGVLNQGLSLIGCNYLAQHPRSSAPRLLTLELRRAQLESFPVAPQQNSTVTTALAAEDPLVENFFLIELCLLELQAQNRALRDGRRLFCDELEELRTRQPLQQILRQLKQTPKSPVAEFGNRSLLDLLQAPLAAAPDNLEQQLAFLRHNWHQLLPTTLLEQIDSAVAIRHDDLQRLEPFTPPAATAPGFADDEETANFTADRSWMPRSVLLAKAVFVWLCQLTDKYQREISRLDQIPDEELDQLRDFGFSGLWLIGIWQRSEASRRIKHLHGKSHVSASAYAIHDYRIADQLGGETALENLRQRCLQRGIQLACDVVTNHTGIDSQWVRQHPDWFIQSQEPPYPGYRYTSSDLSNDDRLCIQIEDGYYDHSEAAVVFCRRDLHSGEVRYIYHGNDGTHLPWNDTAQLDFLLPQVREAMIGVILNAARKFGIIRFDAAMTLAKKHFQRLWYPLPGGGEGVPSRSARAMSNAEFNRHFPVEFWREVVERIKAEQPDTLLIAEAFWLMEGYFVRTLGMHRVYNSAFMNMLKTEENRRYRKTLREILAFEPAILQRFVNFMSNPDEETALEQFGNSDKYFCIATLLCTMPGLPLFAHGQLEGLREKYGMEYTRPAWQETPDQRLIDDHWRLLAPLLRCRKLFSGAENFQLYDFISAQGIEEDVYVFSNTADNQQVLVLCNNSPHPLSGRIADALPRPQGNRPLSAALNLTATEGYILCRSLNSDQEVLQLTSDFRTGPSFYLPAYSHLVLDSFEPLAEDARWQRLYRELDNHSNTALHERYLLLELTPILDKIKHWLRPGGKVPEDQQITRITEQFQQLCTSPPLQDLSCTDLLRAIIRIALPHPTGIELQLIPRLCHEKNRNQLPGQIIKQLFDRTDLQGVLEHHEYNEKIWFSRESLENLLLLILSEKLHSHNSSQNNINELCVFFKNVIINTMALLQLAEKSSYLLDNFLQGLSAVDLPARQILPLQVSGGGPHAMKILFVTPEATPFAKTGGLADVAGSLPRALRQRGHDVRVIMPCYRSVQRNGFSLAKGRKAIEVNLGGELIRAGLRQTIWEGVPYHFIDTPEYFDREYLYGTPEGDYQDNARRFTFFCRAVLEYLRRADFRPDILHLHDWQTALIPALLKTERAADPFFASTATLLTIHNLGYQGIFPLTKVERLGLPQEFTSTEHLEYFGNISLLKGGIVHADLINTVSETYCHEIQQPDQGHGFDGLLRSRSRDLYGILNGINDKSWDPALDPALNKPFSSANLNGKRSCKRALQKELGLEDSHDRPLVAVVSRLDRQKGIDLIEQIWPQLMKRKLQFVLLGSGDQEQMAFWQKRQQENSGQFSIGLQFDENLSRRIYAAADCLLVPSRYEPCGLTQMIALRYGALPIVRHTGGLADTVHDIQQNPRTGNGFVFNEATAQALLATIDRALALYPQRSRWLALVKKGMESNFSWDASAQRYEELYSQALADRRSQ